MRLAVFPGLGGRLTEALARCTAWEQAHGQRIEAALLLGDVPLRHDLSRRTGGGAPEAVGLSIADYVHGRVQLPFPILILAGERDDPSLLKKFSATRPGHELRKPAFVVIESGRVFALGSLLAAGFSGYAPVSAAGAPLRPARTSRLQSRILLSKTPGSIPVLFSHDCPDLGDRSSADQLSEVSEGSWAGEESAADGSPAHPGLLLRRILDRLQPDLLLFGHALHPGVFQHGKSRLIGLSPWPASGGDCRMAVLDSESLQVEIG